MTDEQLTVARPFAAVLQELARGAAQSEASDLLHELVSAVEEHGKAGTLTLTLKVKPAGKGIDGLLIGYEVKMRKPEGDRADSIFFTDDSGNLTRTDPRQQQLPLRGIPRPNRATEVS